jgi:hypothetical protein
MYWYSSTLQICFVLIAQFNAFFIITSWLFSIIYIFFTMDKYENYLYEKRIQISCKYKL